MAARSTAKREASTLLELRKAAGIMALNLFHVIFQNFFLARCAEYIRHHLALDHATSDARRGQIKKALWNTKTAHADRHPHRKIFMDDSMSTNDGSDLAVVFKERARTWSGDALYEERITTFMVHDDPTHEHSGHRRLVKCLHWCATYFTTTVMSAAATFACLRLSCLTRSSRTLSSDHTTWRFFVLGMGQYKTALSHSSYPVATHWRGHPHECPSIDCTSRTNETSLVSVRLWATVPIAQNAKAHKRRSSTS